MSTVKIGLAAARPWVCIAAALAVLAPASSFAQQLQLDRLNRLSAQALHVVDVTLDSSMLQLASGLFAGDKDGDSIKTLIAGLRGVFVKSFEFDREGVYADADVDAIRAQLKAPWTRVVNIDSRTEHQRVEVYIWRERDQSGGLALVSSVPKQLTIVNIVGRIDLSQLAGLQGVLGIPPAAGTLPGADPTRTPPRR